MSQMDEPDELLDLVNEQDEVIGTIVREDVTKLMAGAPGYVRATNAFIVNSKGEIWAPRRSAHKKIAPHGLDYSVGEHVQAGESYLEGMIRGFKEELGLAVSERQLEFVGKMSQMPAGLPYFASLFIYRSDAVPNYNTEDFVSYEWLTPEVFLEKLEAGAPAKRDLKLSLDLFLKAKK